MKNLAKLFCLFAFCFGATHAGAIVIGAEYTAENPWVGNIEINSGSSLEDLTIINNGVITGTITITGNVAVSIQNNGEIVNPVVCNNCLPINISQVIADNNSINPISGLDGHTVVIRPGAEEIHLSDVFAIAGNAHTIKIQNIGTIIDFGITDVHPDIDVDSWTAVSFEVRGLPDGWKSTEPLLTHIGHDGDTHNVDVSGIDKLYVADGYVANRALYVNLSRRTDYSIVMENEMGDWLDDLRVMNPDDKLLGALDSVWSRAELNDMLSRLVRTNPIKLMSPLRSMNSFVLGEHLHDLEFGIVAEPFYIYSGDFSVLGGGVGVSGRVAKNLTAKVGAYAGRINYDNELDNYNGMLYGANFDAMYRDSDFYARAVGTMSAANFKGIEVFDGVRGVQNPNGISAAAAIDGGIVFNVFDEIDVVPFVGARFDYAHVLNFSDIDANLRFGLNVDKCATVDGNRYAFGLHAFGQTDGEIYAGIYTDMMSVVDGVGGRLDFGILHDDFGMSYRIKFDAKFEF